MYARRSFATAFLVSTALAAPALAKVAIRPGLYETTSRITAMSGNGLKPAQIQKILTGKPQIQRQCITAAEIARSDWYINDREAGCTYKDASTHGRISATAQCAGGRMQKIAGSYTPTSFSITAAGGSAKGSATVSMSGKLVGACIGNEDELEDDE